MRPVGDSGFSTLSRMVSAISSGECTRRTWLPVSIHRTYPGSTGAKKSSRLLVKCCARACSALNSGDTSATAARARCTASMASRSMQTTASHSAGSMPSGAAPRHLRRPARAPPAACRAWPARCRSWTNSSQGAKPRACCCDTLNNSVEKLANWPVLNCCPMNWTPISLNWCASSNTTDRTVGSNSATPDSRTLKSAKNRW